MDYRKTIENITCYICMTLIALCIIIYFIAVEMIDAENKQKKVNELQNQVEQQNVMAILMYCKRQQYSKCQKNRRHEWNIDI